jgi:aldehyde:ferredoxin oxidoreductase
MKANTGKIIRVDLNTGAVNIETLPEDYYSKYVGGSGLAAKYFWEKGDFNADALSPEAMLVFMNGPFAGLKLSGASRNSTAGRSPLTGHWADSSCGGFFAPELRYAGYDGIAITGKSSKPSVLVIEDDKISIEDGTEYWGKGIEGVNIDLKKKYGKAYRTVIIGPAGENLVKFACIMNEGHHVFGRAGFGAVMGSKNLKAILVKAAKKEMVLANPVQYEKLRKGLNPKMKAALAANVLHENGTAANLEGGAFTGDVPIKNWTSNFWEEMADALTGSTLTEKYLTKRSACAYCAIACKRIVEVKEGAFAVSEGPGPEYETIVAYGSMMGSLDLAATCKANRICNDMGMDTISSGVTIAWAMEAFEKGDITEADTDGVRLEWGDMKTVINTVLPKMAKREGKLGALLAEGSTAAAEKVGKGSINYTTQCKRLEAPMHDPRGGGHGMALTYAMGARGACHVSDPMLFIEMGACFYPEIGFEYDLEPKTDENKPESAVIAVELGALENSACFCQFADREVSIPEWLELFNTVPGYNWESQDMMTAGRRVFFLKRLLNYRYGLTAKDDELTQRMLEPARDGEPEGTVINFKGMKEKFYKLMDIDPVKGIPSKATLEKYGLKEESAKVW